MKIKEIMVSDVISVSPRTAISKVADILFANRFHSLPVVDGGKLVGIITEDDFFIKNFSDLYLPSYLRFLRENRNHSKLPDEIKDKIEKLLGMKVREIMTDDCVVVHPETEIEELMKTIKETKFTAFPVTDKDGRLVGIVTLSDILGTVRKGAAEMNHAFQGKFRSKEAEELAREINALWREKLVLMSRKRIRTWKGIALIFFLSTIGLSVLIYASFLSRGGSSADQPDVYRIECQRFRYSEWGACSPDKLQVRSVDEALPKDCIGGTPDLVQPCK